MRPRQHASSKRAKFLGELRIRHWIFDRAGRVSHPFRIPSAIDEGQRELACVLSDRLIAHDVDQ